MVLKNQKKCDSILKDGIRVFTKINIQDDTKKLDRAETQLKICF